MDQTTSIGNLDWNTFALNMAMFFKEQGWVTEEGSGFVLNLPHQVSGISGTTYNSLIAVGNALIMYFKRNAEARRAS